MIALAAAGLLAAGAAGVAPEQARRERFFELLRTYPQRPVIESHQLVEALIAEGAFADRDRAIHWLGSAKLAAKDVAGARAAFAQLRREYPSSQFVPRTLLGEADAAAFEGRYPAALAWLERARAYPDPAVQQMARIAEDQLRLLLSRERWAWGASAFGGAVLAWLALSLWQRRPIAVRPLPAEVQALLAVLGVIALLSVRQDPAPRMAVLWTCAAGALLATLTALHLRAARPAPLGAALHVSAALGALGAAFYVAIWRAGLIGFVVETFRPGPN